MGNQTAGYEATGDGGGEDIEAVDEEKQQTLRDSIKAEGDDDDDENDKGGDLEKSTEEDQPQTLGESIQESPTFFEEKKEENSKFRSLKIKKKKSTATAPPPPQETEHTDSQQGSSLDPHKSHSEGSPDVGTYKSSSRMPKIRSPKIKLSKNSKAETISSPPPIVEPETAQNNNNELEEEKSEDSIGVDQQVIKKKKFSFRSKKKGLEEPEIKKENNNSEQNQEEIKKFNSFKNPFTSPKNAQTDSKKDTQLASPESEPRSNNNDGEVKKFNSKKNLFSGKSIKSDSSETKKDQMVESNDTLSPEDVKKFKKDKFSFKSQTSVKSLKSQNKKGFIRTDEDEDANEPPVEDDKELLN